MMHALPSFFEFRSDGNLFLKKPLSTEQLDILTKLSSFIVSKPAFNDERLFLDFFESLRSNSLISRPEITELRNVQHLITLFAVSAMHNCNLILDKKRSVTAKVLTHFDPLNSKTIEVHASAPVPFDDRQVNVALPAFTTKLGGQYLAKALVEEPLPWEFDVELTPDGVLDRLR